ncbi:MAG: cytochrome-c peroxidase, partial [Gemmatimonadota bacterium]
HGFTGRIGDAVEERLGRPLDPALVEAGRLLFFDPVTSLNGDNTCAGCHAPNASFGGTQSIAIGVENNGIVGPNRTGPRNFRRSPTVANSALFPQIMLNSRFAALSGDPFDNSAGFSLLGEPSSLDHMPHLLAAQAFMPVVDRSEMAGFHFEGSRDEMRAEIARRVDALERYRDLFARAFPAIAEGEPIRFDHIGVAMAEFQASLVFADAPIDAFARGRGNALTPDEKRGALLFFGKAECASCHAADVPFASGDEMFTDYRHYVLGVPQIVPDETNVTFAGPDRNQDFGREDVTGDEADRYAFRTSPLRNVALQPWFMHNGAFRRLEDAIRHHLDAYESARGYSPSALDPDLSNLGPIEPVLARLDPRIADPPELTTEEFDQLVDFVRCGLLDPAARPERLRHVTPRTLPSGEEVHTFERSSSAELVAQCARGRSAGLR